MNAYLRLVTRDADYVWTLSCPGCGLRADLDDDMFHGRVSTQCPECSFHETVTWREYVNFTNPLYKGALDAIEIPETLWPSLQGEVCPQSHRPCGHHCNHAVAVRAFGPPMPRCRRHQAEANLDELLAELEPNHD